MKQRRDDEEWDEVAGEYVESAKEPEVIEVSDEAAEAEAGPGGEEVEDEAAGEEPGDSEAADGAERSPD